MKKTLSVFLAIAMAVSCISIVSLAETNKSIANGNAESGLTADWSAFRNNGTVTAVNDGANGTEKSIRFTPKPANQYGMYTSIAYHVGPAIVQDSANGYNGAGATTYSASFWAKAAEGKGGTFGVAVDFPYNLDPGKALSEAQQEAIKDVKGEGRVWASNTVTMTDKWQKFDVQFTVSETFMQLIEKLHGFGTISGTDAYDLQLRLDGTKGAFNKDVVFDYYVDELTFAAEGADNATPTPGGNETPSPATPGITATPTPKVAQGFTITYNEDTDGNHYLLSKTGILSAKDIVNSSVARKFIIRNNGEEDLQAKLTFQVTHTKGDGGRTWIAPGDYYTGGDWTDLPAGEQIELEYSMKLEGTKMTINAQGNEATYDVSDFFIRIDLPAEELPAGTSVTVFCNEDIAKSFMEGNINFRNKATMEYVYSPASSSSTGSGDVLPVILVVLTVVASASLAVIVRKRKEIA